MVSDNLRLVARLVDGYNAGFHFSVNGKEKREKKKSRPGADADSSLIDGLSFVEPAGSSCDKGQGWGKGDERLLNQPSRLRSFLT